MGRAGLDEPVGQAGGDLPADPDVLADDDAGAQRNAERGAQRLVRAQRRAERGAERLALAELRAQLEYL